MNSTVRVPLGTETSSGLHFAAARLAIAACVKYAADAQYCKFLWTCVRQNFLVKPAHYDGPDLVAPRALERLFA